MVKSICKGVMYAVISTLLLVLLMAFVVKIANWSDDVIKPIMQVIKIVGIFIGVLIGLKQIPQRGWLYGGIIGALYMVFTFLIFSLLDGNFSIGWTALGDLGLQTLTGIIIAIFLRLRNKDVAMV